MLVRDTEDYGNLLQLALNRIELPENPDVLILRHTRRQQTGDRRGIPAGQCTNLFLFDVTKGDIIQAIHNGCTPDGCGYQSETKAGTGCGGCVPLILRC